MSTLIGFPGGQSPPPVVVPEPLERRAPAQDASRNSPPVTTKDAQTEDLPPPPSRQDIDIALAELRDAMARLPGSDREVSLHYQPEDHSYLVEIRNKETGAILQTFPPENLLNLWRRSADLLGVLIDRHS